MYNIVLHAPLDNVARVNRRSGLRNRCSCLLVAVVSAFVLQMFCVPRSIINTSAMSPTFYMLVYICMAVDVGCADTCRVGDICAIQPPIRTCTTHLHPLIHSSILFCSPCTHHTSGHTSDRCTGTAPHACVTSTPATGTESQADFSQEAFPCIAGWGSQPQV